MSASSFHHDVVKEMDDQSRVGKLYKAKVYRETKAKNDENISIPDVRSHP